MAIDPELKQRMDDIIEAMQDTVDSIPTELSELEDDSTHRVVTDTEKATWNGKYSKPSTGIPKTDLASDVQTSLGKADSAIQDISGKQNVSDNSLSTTDKTVVGAINEVNSIAKGANQALIADDYNELIFELNSATKDELNEGQNFYIRTVNVPDLWVYKIENSSIPYVYSGDAQVITDLEENGYIQVGFYKLAVLETQGVNLTNYALKSWVEAKNYLTQQDISGKQNIPSIVSSGTEITLANNTEYFLTDVSTLTLSYPQTTHFECYLKITTANSGNITLIFDIGTTFIGKSPVGVATNGETWEISIKDKVVVAQKVGDGT